MLVVFIVSFFYFHVSKYDLLTLKYIKCYHSNYLICFVLQIVERLRDHDKHLHAYLDALLINNYETSKKYHGLLVGLYADYSPDRLMSFLKSSDHYPIQVTVEIIEVNFKNSAILIDYLNNFYIFFAGS